MSTENKAEAWTPLPDGCCDYEEMERRIHDPVCFEQWADAMRKSHCFGVITQSGYEWNRERAPEWRIKQAEKQAKELAEEAESAALEQAMLTRMPALTAHVYLGDNLTCLELVRYFSCGPLSPFAQARRVVHSTFAEFKAACETEPKPDVIIVTTDIRVREEFNTFAEPFFGELYTMGLTNDTRLCYFYRRAAFTEAL